MRKSKDKLGCVTTAILEMLAVGGTVTLIGFLSQGRTAPKLLRGLKEYSVWRINKLLAQLKLRGFIHYDPDDEFSPVLLTEKGFVRLAKEKIKSRAYPKWDHLWRLIVFDISEQKRTRRAFQRSLTEIGCFKVQRSIYAYPYDCKNELMILASNKNIKHEVAIFTVPYLAQYEKSARDFYFSR
ncbi:MAG: CRISPR-associated endonuclease Cas2 [Patescibacteria group bacterium]